MNTLADILDDPVPEGASGLARGVCRLLRDMGYTPLLEFPLNNGRRVDVMGLDRKGRFLAVEVKASLNDFRTDHKWPEYLDHCDGFYFAVDTDFPREVLPGSEGLIVADAFQAAVARPAAERAMNGSRRKAQTLLFALTAARRLARRDDPEG